MPNILNITVENPDELLNEGAYGTDALIRLQSAATEDGTFADVAGTGSTPEIPLLAGTRSYTGYDPAGASSTWYRTRYESANAARLSDWTAALQVGDATAGLLCSLDGVKRRIFGGSSNNTDDDDLILELIREVSDDIEDYVGAWLAPRPTDPASTMTLLLDVEASGPELELRSGGRLVGIRQLTALGLARTSQPEVGGTYAAATLADILLRPRPTAEAPASRLLFTNYPTGPYACFEAGYNTVSATGSFGPAAVASRIQGIAEAAVTRRFIGKETAAAAVAVGPDGGVRLLADISPGMKATLDRMRGGKVG